MADTAKVDSKKIKIGLQSGSKRDVYAQWDFSFTTSGTNRVEKYEYEWEYLTNATDKWFDGGTGSVNHPTKTATYSTPSNAIKVRFRVKPVAKTYKSDDKDVEYFTGSWSDWVKFKDFIFKSTPPTKQVKPKELELITHPSGDSGDARPYVEAVWKVNASQIDYVKTFDYQFQYYDPTMKEWTDTDGDSGTMPDLTSAQKKNIKEGKEVKLTKKFFIRTGQIEGRTVALYSQVRFSVTPVATDDGGDAFKPAVQRATVNIKFDKIKIENLRVSGSREENKFTAFWSVNSPLVDHIDSFQVQWRYDADERNYFNDITRSPEEDIWIQGDGSPASVDAKSYFINAKTKHKGWLLDFNPPYDEILKPNGSVVKKFRTIQIRVMPKCDETQSFIEEYSKWEKYSAKIGLRSVSTLEVTTPNPLSPRHVLAKWRIEDETYLASFSYSYKFTTTDGGIYSAPTTGSVDALQVQTDANGRFWGVEFDVDSNAKVLEFDVMPVPKTDTGFNGVYHGPVVISFARAKVKTIDNLATQIYNPANREVLATWDPLDIDSLISEGGISLDDLGIHGDPSQYTPEELERLKREALLSSYEVRWQYYFLDTWFTGTGSSTTTDLYSQYTVPEEADMYRVSVRPVSANEELFVGIFSKWKEVNIQPDPCELDIDKVDIQWDELESSKLNAIFRDLGSIPIDSSTNAKADVAFLWTVYKYGGWTSAGDPDVVSVGTGIDYIMSTFQVEEGVEKVRLQIKPVIDTLEYFGVYSGFSEEVNAVIPAAYIENLEVTIQKGSKRTCVASWTSPGFIHPDNVENYSYEWEYMVDSATIWYPGSNGDVGASTPVTTYDAPEIAEAVRIRVRPNPKLAQHFTGGWCEPYYFSVPEDTTPDVPNVPTIEVIDAHNFRATVDTYDLKTSSIKFEVVNEMALWRSDTVKVDLNRAIFQFDVAPGHKYRVRAAGANDAGELGDWSNYSSDQASAPPPLEVIPEVIATSGTSVELTWEAPSTGEVSKYIIEYAKKKSYFDAAPSMVQSAEVTITRAELEQMDTGTEWFFRICTENSTGASSRSDWSEIVSVILGSIPTAPTTWSSRTTAKIGEDIYLYWTHNCADESAETSAILELTINGEETIEIEIEPPEEGTSYYLLDGSEITQEAVIEWRVKTAGVMMDEDNPSEHAYGDWSTQRIVKIFTPPTLQLTLGESVNWEWDTFNFNDDNIYSADGEIIPLANNTIERFPVVVKLDASPASQTPTSYILSVTSNSSYTEADETGMTRQIIIGQEIFKKYYNTRERNYTTLFLPENINLENSMSYTIKATVSMDSGLSAEVNQIFTVSWTDKEYIIDAEIGFDKENLTTSVRPFAMDEDGVYPDDLTLSVFRRESDGTFVKLGEKLSNTVRPTIVDPHPALDFARYRIVAQSKDTGAISFYDLPGYPIGETGLVIQWDEQWTSYDVINADAFSERPWTGSMIKLPYNVKVSDSNNVDLEMIEYIGRRHPVSYYGTQVGQKLSLTSEFDKRDKELIYALRRLAVYLGNAYVREPNGSGYWAHVEVSFNADYDSVVVPVSIAVTRVEGGA